MYLGKIKFLHKGLCGPDSGWLSPNSIQESIDDCRKECSSRAEVNYFAYANKKGNNCACYKTDCNSDGEHLDFMFYEILESGNKIFSDIFIALFFNICLKVYPRYSYRN